MTLLQIAASVHDMYNGEVVLRLATSHVRKLCRYVQQAKLDTPFHW